MTTTSAPHAETAAPSVLTAARAGLWILLAAHVVTGWGTQWDVRWHLLIGRDSFWIPPHVMTYSGITAIVLASFGVLAWTSIRARVDPGGAAGTIRVLGVTGTRGYHLAAWGIALTVLAAPIDDLWHRLFGLDVTLWSPPHLLGLVGGIINSAACWLIAGETYPVGSRAWRTGVVLAGALVYAGIGLGLQPGIRIGYVYGGVMFFTYPILAALLVPLALVVTARISRLRTAPVLALVIVLLMSIAGAAVARVGFAWIHPVSFIAEEIAKDPTSPIAIVHEMARKNGTTLGGFNPRLFLVPLLAGVAMVAVDARRRPVLASLAYGLTLFVGVDIILARMPAFAESLPSALVTAVAAVVTALAALAGGALAGRATGDGHASPRRWD